jgi:glycosyltransferase involved in cell wall biosynthesis
MISIIIPSVNDSELVRTTLAGLSDQSGDFEVIVVDDGNTKEALSLEENQTKVVSASSVTRGETLNTGASAANGETLLFLWPGSRLPSGALDAIERNLKLLPQTVGGNFHLKFSQQNFFTGLLARLLKQWRYQGRYYGHSGVFIRKDAYLALGGFRPYDVFEDYDLIQRLEKYGPTLYLPETVVALLPRSPSLKTLFLYGLIVFGIDPLRLVRLR